MFQLFRFFVCLNFIYNLLIDTVYDAIWMIYLYSCNWECSNIPNSECLLKFNHEFNDNITSKKKVLQFLDVHVLA